MPIDFCRGKQNKRQHRPMPRQQQSTRKMWQRLFPFHASQVLACHGLNQPGPFFGVKQLISSFKWKVVLIKSTRLTPERVCQGGPCSSQLGTSSLVASGSLFSKKQPHVMACCPLLMEICTSASNNLQVSVFANRTGILSLNK